jgi:uncharacterized protein (TIGR03086 family)
MNRMQHYRRAQEEFDTVVAAVPADAWEAPSACSAWTVRDVAGHLIWGQEQLRHWAAGTEYTGAPGGPGTPHPAQLTGPDPVGTWRAARAATNAILSDDALRRTVTLPGLGTRPLSAIVTLLITDHLAHAWDIAHSIELDVRLPPDLIAGSLAWARDNVARAPGLFGPELAPPAGADEQTRWLAYLGRAAWQPVAAGR